jgi:ankyrin repeat protein
VSEQKALLALPLSAEKVPLMSEQLRTSVITSDVDKLSLMELQDLEHQFEYDGLNTCWHYASMYNDARVLELLLKASQSWKGVWNKRRNGCLHVAAMTGSGQCLALLLNSIAKDETHLVDAQNEWGETSLHLAYQTGSIECIDMLRAFGANTQICDNWGQLPEAVGVEYVKNREPKRTAQAGMVLSKCIEAPLDEPRFMELLNSPNVDLKGKDMYGLTAMHKLAAWNNHIPLIALLARMDDIAPQDPQGNTPLHLAVEMGSIRTKCVLEKRYSPEQLQIRNSSGKTYLEV